MSNNKESVVSETTVVMGTTEETTPQKEAPKASKKPTPKNKAAAEPKNATPNKKGTGKGKKAKKAPYKRGSLSAAIYALFDKEGVDNVGYEASLALARSIKTDTKFNRYHLAWYKNNYRNRQED